TELRQADIFLNPRRQGLLKWIEQGDLSPFESILVYTTALRVLADSSKILPQFLVPNVTDPYERHRERVLYDLQSLAELPREQGPKFVFLHLVSPHQPFVFGPEGEPLNPSGAFTLLAHQGDGDRDLAFKGYIDQIRFLNSRFIPLLDQIIAESGTPPIIILQADHGPPVGAVSAENRMRILNAYYLPGIGEAVPYESISPVNTFRMILREYFEADLPLVEDTAYYSSYKHPYDYSIISDGESD
ncbi:MAG: LTA synthase family protein, partial [Thermoleophilia bacterium]|nr:LTA synthase family protein [Thermoleophilia bacterium]